MLTADGFHPWLDEVDLLPGQDWESEIRNAISQCDVVIVCLSRYSVDAIGFLQKEIRLALDAADERPDGLIFVVPARLEECRLPHRLARWQVVDLFSAGGYQRLVASLKAARADGSPPRISMALQTGASQPPSIRRVRIDGLYLAPDGPHATGVMRFRDTGVCALRSFYNHLFPNMAELVFLASRSVGVPGFGMTDTFGVYVQQGDNVTAIFGQSVDRIRFHGLIGNDGQSLHLQCNANGLMSFSVWQFALAAFPNHRWA
jgi:hypothetical protein